jgi:hypothetical protein
LVRAVVVVFVPPVVEEELGFEEGVEGLEVEEFVAEVAVEGLDLGVLPGGAGLDVGDGGGVEAAPVFECFGGQFGPVVAADEGGSVASLFDHSLERVDGVVGGDPAGRRGGEGFPGVLVRDREDLDRPPVSRAIDEEVECPRQHTQRVGLACIGSEPGFT